MKLQRRWVKIPMHWVTHFSNQWKKRSTLTGNELPHCRETTFHILMSALTRQASPQLCCKRYVLIDLHLCYRYWTLGRILRYNPVDLVLPQLSRHFRCMRMGHLRSISSFEASALWLVIIFLVWVNWRRRRCDVQDISSNWSWYVGRNRGWLSLGKIH